MTEEDEKSWFESLPQQDQLALEMVVRASGVSPRVYSMYARWWQLETWLRQLTYVELRARDGQRWQESLDRRTNSRQEKDQQSRRYMASPDWEDPMAYLDAGLLFDLLESHWDLVGPSLIDKNAWLGRREELLAIRHRIGHLRRPHADDLNRLEQTLRDLESGAKESLRRYNRRSTPTAGSHDLVIDAWVSGNHQETHLIDHAYQQYGTSFRLDYSRRPWATPGVTEPSGQAGYLWHVNFYTSRWLNLKRFWRDSYLNAAARGLAVHVLCDSHHDLTMTFAAVDDASSIADAIGEVFHAFLGAASLTPPRGYDDDLFTQLDPPAAPDDPRVMVGSTWNIVDDTTEPITIFGA